MNKVLLLLLAITSLSCSSDPNGKIITISGPVSPDQLGITLAHEHVLVDFSGVKNYSSRNYNRQDALERILPELQKLKAHGVQTLIECTPNYVGRDVVLLKQLTEKSGIKLMTNTGFYGAQNNKFIPAHVIDMSAEAIATFFIAEFEQGIEGSGIKPGFIKIAVNRKPLSEFHAKLVRAAAIAHQATGLTIMSHTGPATPAFQQLEILSEEGVAPSAFIWTHASDEKDWDKLAEAARLGAWISIDKFGWNASLLSGELLLFLKNEGVLDKILVSHDAGWYDPNKPNHPFKSYTPIFETLIPNLKVKGFCTSEIEQLLVKNPAQAFTVAKRLISPSN